MNPEIISNPIIDKLPPHLHQFIIPQNYNQYTNQDQAIWRYVMRKNIYFLSKVAHPLYVKGLKKTGVSINEIPNMYGMNRILKEIGWAAVAVDGFIPPAAFMEFQAYNVLVIASDIRTLDHIEYTPAPDIIHEAAGHAPIIANPEYAEYLRRLGAIGSKAISSAKDWEIYLAVRKLSQLKELDGVEHNLIEEAENQVLKLQGENTEMSEMSKIRNLQWWSVEYGLIGQLDDFKIYGAGLLSSIGESMWCLSDKVKKLPYTIETANQDFDITQPQPQLFVTPDFPHLSYVLEELANNMALRKGGMNGIVQLINSERLGTLELSTGLQISGIFSEFIPDGRDGVAWFQTKGPTALSFHEKELIGHSRHHHLAGFGSPVGKLRGINLAIEDMSPRDLEAYNIFEGRNVKLEFEGGVIVSGKVLTGTRNLRGKIMLITFSECHVKWHDKVLFTPDDGLFHMAVGQKITSAYAGPADISSFDLLDHELSPSQGRKKLDEKAQRLEEIFKTLRNERQKDSESFNMKPIINDIRKNYRDHWLVNLELMEYFSKHKRYEEMEETEEDLRYIVKKNPKLKDLIMDGIEMIKSIDSKPLMIP